MADSNVFSIFRSKAFMIGHHGYCDTGKLKITKINKKSPNSHLFILIFFDVK